MHIAERNEKGRFRLQIDTQSTSFAAPSSSAEAGPSSGTEAADSQPQTKACSTEVRRLMLTLKPLKSIEATLRQRLGAEVATEKPRLDQEAVLTRQRRGLIRNSSYVPPETPDQLPSQKSNATASVDSNSKGKKTLGLRRHRASSSATTTSASSSVRSLSEGSANLQNQRDVFDAETIEATSPVSPSSVSDTANSFVVKVRGGTGWRRRARIPPNSTDASDDHSEKESSSRPSFDEVTGQEERDLLSARQIIEVFGEDINRLWRNEEVQAVLAAEKVRLDKRPGLYVILLISHFMWLMGFCSFLDDVLRVTAPDYIPEIR